MKMSLLEMVQDILSAMESDEVNSIADTVESLQVAQEIKTTYHDLMSTFDFPSHEGLISLEPSNDSDNPTTFRLPDNVKQIKWITYNNGSIEAPNYVEVHYQEPEEFFRYGSLYNAGQSSIQLVGRFYVFTDRHPTHWTTFDNQTLLFNGFNASVDTTLQESKVVCWGQTFRTFELEDSFVPDLDIALFPLLLSEAKKSCFVNFKGVGNANEERRARRQAVRIQSDLWRANQRRPYNKRPNYSRPNR